MEITRDTVIQWLTEEHRSQSWLAEKCGVSDQAVSNWLREKNFRPISAAAQLMIRVLMEEDEAQKRAKPPHHIVLEFPDDDYACIEQASVAAGVSVREWAVTTLNDAAHADVHSIAATASTPRRNVKYPTADEDSENYLCVAEDPAPYGEDKIAEGK